MNSPFKLVRFQKHRKRCRWRLPVILLIALTMSFPVQSATPPPHSKPKIPLPPTSDSLLEHQTPLPEEADGPFQVWNEKDKYYLVITVPQADEKSSEQDFSLVNGKRVADTLAKSGYQPLQENSSLLMGPQANRGNVLSALESLKDLVLPATVIVYYSGHGVAEEKGGNLWLQLSRGDKEAPHPDITLSEVVATPRKVGYNGELILILDSSYSGGATLSDVLTLGDGSEKTMILISISRKQNIQTITLPEGKESVFTHTLLKALHSPGAAADENHDGILRFSELHRFVRIQLDQHFQNKDISQPITPLLISHQAQDFFIVYRREMVQNWMTDDRQVLQIVALERALSPSISRTQILENDASPKLEVSRQAQDLAQQIVLKTNDLYVKGLIALAEGKLGDARTLLDQAETLKEMQKEKLAKIYLARGRTETYAGRFNYAVPWYKKALALEPPEEAKLLNEYGLVWAQAGLGQEALPFFEQGLRLREKSVDPMDPSLAISLHNLARLYHTDGKYAEAEPLYQRALRITESAYGPKHPSLALQLTNLAGLYRDQRRFAEAEPLYRRALEIIELGFGPEDPKVVVALTNLIEVYRAQEKYVQIEPLYQRLVRILESSLGPTNPKLAYELNNLALIYRTQGKYAEAEPLYQRVVRIDEAALGPTHPEVAIDLNNLAELMRIQGKYAEAEPLYQRSYAIMRQQFGLRHLQTRTVLNNYLIMLEASGQGERARALVEEYQQAIRTQPHP